MATIPGTDLECETLEIQEPICGVYFLLKNGRVMYVGQSRNLLARAWVHRAMKIFDEVRFIRVPPADLNRVELYWIHHFDPPWKCNTINNPTFRYFCRWTKPLCLPPVPIWPFIRHPCGEALTEAHQIH